MNPQAHKIDLSTQCRVDDFVRANFHLAGTLRLHRRALGWDIVRAPINVVLAPIFLLVRLAGLLARLLRLGRLHRWLGSRQIFFTTSVAREIETKLEEDLFGARPISSHGRALIEQYTSVRSAVAEITTSLFVLLAGLLIFGSATPGIVSFAPKVSSYVAHSSAVSNFPLGAGLGSVWYGVFPTAMPIWFVIVVGVALAMISSVVTAFAGIVADPVQAHLGIHKRRLLRLAAKIDLAEGTTSGLEPEHILARVADLSDAGISLIRFFRS